MRRLVPPFILEKYNTGARHGEFVAAVLIVDVTAFTNFTEALMQRGQEAAELLADAMQIVFEPLVQHIWSQQGFVADFAGDSVIAIFPGRQQALYRALAAARAIHQHRYTFRHERLPLGDFRPVVRLGLATGQVEWGIIRNTKYSGPTLAQAIYYFGGAALADAARLETEVAPGTIGLTPAAASQLDKLVEGVPKGAHVRVNAIKGALPRPHPPALPPDSLPGQRTFLPPAIHSQQLRGEFRQLATLFLGVQGANSYDELASLVGLISELQETFGGYLVDIERGESDSAFLFLWGMPATFENDVARALNFVWRLTESSPLVFRAGLTYRPMYAGLVGAASRQEYGGYGQGINLAARLLQEASWGQVWVDENAARHAAADFRLELLGRLPLKGFAERQPVHLLRGPRRSQSRGFYPGQLVGRERELARLVAFLSPMAEGKFAGTMLIHGEAGIGKSRLVHTLEADSAHLSSVAGELGVLPQWFLCPTNELLHQSLHPFRYFLRTYFGQRESADENANRQAFTRRLAALLASTPEPDLVEELERTQSFLAALLELHRPDSLYAQLDEERRFENTLIALKAFFKAESVRRPVILHLEDAHWLDDNSRHFLQELTRNVENYPLALILTVRPDENPDALPAFSAYQEMLLARLSATELELLAANFLGGPIAASLSELVWRRAEGNPLFAEQILLYLREEQFLVRDSEGHYSLAVLPDWALPGNVRSLLVARLDRLRPPVKEVVQTASVLGREFDLAVLAQMLPTAADLPAHVEAATAAAIWTPLDESRYLFRHILLRDAAYEMQLRARRRRLHQLAAEAMVLVYAPELGPRAADLAHHYDAAGEREIAVDWYRRAAQHASARYANEVALGYYSRALSLLPDGDLEERFALLRARCQIYDVQGNRAAQLGDLAVLAALAERLGEEAEGAVALQQAVYANAIGDYTDAIASARRAVTLSETAAAHWEWGKALWRQRDDAAARGHFEQALALAQEVEDVQMVARSLNGLGMIADSEGAYDEAAEYYAKALHYQQTAEDLPGQSLTFTNLGWMAFMQGRIFQAQMNYEKALFLNRKTGDRLSQSTALNNLGVVVFLHGDLNQALEYYQQGLALSQEVGNRSGEATLLSNLALLYHRLGENEMALAHSEKAIALARELDIPSVVAEARTHQGHALLALGRVEAATTAYQRSLSMWEEVDRPQMALEALAGLVRAALQEEDLPAARRLAAQLFDRLEEGAPDGVLEPYRVYFSCYQGLAAAGDPHASSILEEAYWKLQAQAAKIQDEVNRARFLAGGPARQSIVRLREQWPASA